MNAYKEFILEMTSSEALSVLGLNSKFTDSELKTAFRKASSIHHPDRGGSTEKMQDVNSAYELLKKIGGKASEDEQLLQRMKEWREMAGTIRDDLVKNLDIDAYTKYFSDVKGVDMTATVNRIYPNEAELIRLAGVRGGRSAPHHVSYDIQWSDADNKNVFEMHISISVIDVFNSKGLGSSKSTYTMGVSTFAYSNGRKLKITARDYDRTSNKGVFTDPKVVFPLKKISNRKATKFKKADMLAALTREIKAEKLNNDFLIPLQGEHRLHISRMVWNRQAIWNVNGAWLPKSKYSWYRDKTVDSPFMSLPENEETLDIFRKIKGMDAKKALDLIEREYKKLL